MIPEEDFETWKLIITTVTDDIVSFGAMLPDLKRLMKSVEETNYLPGDLSLYTDDFVEDTFPNITYSLLESVSPKDEKKDNIYDFLKSTINLCTSKITEDAITKDSNESESFVYHKATLTKSINMIQILSKIFDKIDLNQNPNEKEKTLDQNLFNYFLDDLKGIEKCNSAIDSINLYIDKNDINTDTSNNDQKDKNNSNFGDILEKESFKLSLIFKLIQKVVFATTIKEKIVQDEKSNKIQIEKNKYENYYNQIHSLINKSFPVFQKIISKNLRKFDVSHLDCIFNTIEKYYQIDFSISSEDEFPLIFNLVEPSHCKIFSTFLKSSFFDKHLYALKCLSLLCCKSEENFKNNKEYFESDEEKRKNKKLNIYFIDKNILLKVVIDNLDVIQNLHFNKEFGEELGLIYSFLIQNKEGIITIEYIKKLWSNVQFIHSADRNSFYTIFERVSNAMNEKDNNEFIDYVFQHISVNMSDDNSKSENSMIYIKIDTKIIEFLYLIIINYERKKYRAAYMKVRDLFWSISFNENEIQTKEFEELKDLARKRISFLCDFCSNEILEKLVNEKLSIISDSINKEEKEFIFKLCANSITKQEEVKNEICTKIVQFCISQLPDKSAINILTNICTTQKVSLEKEQIEQLSNISNKFLTNILLSSGFDDNYIENFFLTTKNIDNDLYDLIEKYVIEKNIEWNSIENDYLTHLPFEKEDLLWTFSIKQSNVNQKFINKLCQIYSNNDGVLLTDKQMINGFLNRINYLINDVENRENCYRLLQKFIEVVDESNPNLIDIIKHDKTKDDIIVTFDGIKGKFKFSKNNSTLVAFYQASKSLNISINQIDLIYNNSPIQMNKSFLSIALMKDSINFSPKILNNQKTSKIKHLRTVSPSTLISHSNLMDKIISFLIDDTKKDTSSFYLLNLLCDLPTSAPIVNMINYFYLMKEIDFKRLFPINHPRFYLYCLNALEKVDDELKKEFIRTKGIEYLIYSLTRVDNLLLIIEIIDYLKAVLNTDEMIVKYSDQLFEALMRLSACLDASYQESCLSFMKKLKPKEVPLLDPEFKLQFVDISNEKVNNNTNNNKESEKDKNDNDNRIPLYKSMTSSELSFYQESSDYMTLSSFISYESIESIETNLIKSQDSLARDNEKTVKIDNELPLSHIISIVIAITFIQKNVYINTTIEPKSEKPSAYLKKTSKETFIELPIPSEYFEVSFPYLDSSNYKEFFEAFAPHAKPPTDTTIQFIIDNLNGQSKYLPFIMNLLKLIINDIKDEDKRNKIFKFIFDNIFILDRNESIEDKVFENAMIIASNAPIEMIIERIKEIGIPEFNKYRIYGKDFKPDKLTTGLKNLGFTCYFNSILQQFYHCPKLRKALIEYKGDDQLIKELGILFSTMRDGSLKFVSPENVIENWICWDGEKLNPRIQQDASEFAIMMIDKLASVIPNSMFNGKLLFKVEGINNEENQYYTERNEPFSVLILPINQSKTLEECLSAFNAPSFFTDQNQYYADTLKRKIDAKQRDFIQELPDHLILQLKRFEYDYSVGTRKKIDKAISISKEIDVSSICEFKNIENKPNTKYNLCGVIMHSGTAMGGHYFSFAKQRDTNMWFKFNDSDVTPMTLDDVIHDSNSYNSNAYLLFYDRNDLDEVDDSIIDQSFKNQLLEDMKMNSYYYFYMTNGFTQFLNEISKRPELQKIAVELIIKVLCHANVEISSDFFNELEIKLKNDSEFANSIQDELVDLKFLILNDLKSINKIVTQKVLLPIFSHSVSDRLIQLAIDTFDFAVENLSDSSFYFQVLYSIVERINDKKGELTKLGEENNKNSIEKLNGNLNVISEKVTELMKNGIKQYAQKKSNLHFNYIISSIDLSVIARLFNLFDSIPIDYVELLKDPEFLKNLFSSSNPTVSYFLDNYIRARELHLFDVNSMLKVFFEKESILMKMIQLFKSIFIVFKEEAFPMIWTLKFKFNNNFRTPQDVVLCMSILCKSNFDNEFFISHFSDWIPQIVLHENNDTRKMANIALRYLIPHVIFKKKFGEIPTYNSSMTYTSEFFNSVKLAEKSNIEIKRNAYKLIQCLFGCLKQMKNLIEKDDFNDTLTFSEEKYRAIQLLKLLQASIKIFESQYEIDHDDQEFEPLNYSELVEFGEFLLNTGHSHPFDPHIILILKILKCNSNDKLLMDSIPSEDIMTSSEKLQKIPHNQFDQYMKIIKKTVQQRLKEGRLFTNEFLSKFYKLIVFNLRNLDLIVKSSSPIEYLNAIIESICTKENNSFKSFIDYIDKNFETSITNGLFSCVTGFVQLKMKRPISHLVQSFDFTKIFGNIGIDYPFLYHEIILINGKQSESEDNFNSICYDTLFNDITDAVRCLCEKRKEYNDKYDECRYVIWDYLINNTKKRIDESDSEKKADLRKEIFEQFNSNYNFNYFKLLNGFQKQQKEIDFATQFVLQFVDNENNKCDEIVTDKLVYLSKNSFCSLNKTFDFLREKAPEKIKNGEFISDSLSNETISKNWEIVEKLCNFAFDGKTKDEISSIFSESRIVTNLIDKLNLFNFVYEKGIVENRFNSENEEKLATLIVPIKLIMKYQDKCEISNNERNQLKNASSLLINKLQNINMNCEMKNDVIEGIKKFLDLLN